MEFIPTKCPQCSGELMIPKDTELAFCNYCGSKFYLNKVSEKTLTPTIENWIVLAKTAQKAGNYEEAYSFFTKVLEIDTTNQDAWLGKAQSAGWQSTIENNRILEMVSALDQGLLFIQESERNLFLEQGSRIISDLVNAYFETAFNYYLRNVDDREEQKRLLDTCYILKLFSDRAFAFDSTNTDAVLKIQEIAYIVLNSSSNFNKFSTEERNIKDYWQKTYDWTVGIIGE